MLLRFRVANHGSIRDEMTIALTTSAMRGATPPGGDWLQATTRVAGLYGPNAAGKSTMLDAMDHLVRATRHSATRWAERGAFPYVPFALDDVSSSEPSLYEIDLVSGGIRYTFGFRSTAKGILEEWLYSYPSGRRRVLYERDGDTFSFGRHLTGDNVVLGKATKPTSLFMSSAANNRHQIISPIHHQISRHIKYARLSESDRQSRLQWIMGSVEREGGLLDLAGALLRFADVGITGVKVREETPTDEVARVVRKIHEALATDESNKADLERLMEQMARKLQFVHESSGSDAGALLELAQESSGTVAWLSLAVPAIDALKRGDLFLVDEIDSSLHPSLTSQLIQMFKSGRLNRSGAQLVFTSHDTSLLGGLHGKILDPEEIWLAEKAGDGATDIYSAAEFSIRSRDNIERRYLQGRYGAVPMFSADDLEAVLAEAGGTLRASA
ncbi:AAA family ATPase [Actinoplanes sp. G11-F43]|uniref:AAA family ATPase n=1 Tax=Actinoplanes sp. G11-F43 TaxID=3424130 RepID=UPI003D34BEFF